MIVLSNAGATWPKLVALFRTNRTFIVRVTHTHTLSRFLKWQTHRLLPGTVHGCIVVFDFLVHSLRLYPVFANRTIQTGNPLCRSFRSLSLIQNLQLLGNK